MTKCRNIDFRKISDLGFQCEHHARELTDAEKKRLGLLNLSSNVVSLISEHISIFNVCPYHAAKLLSNDDRPADSVLRYLQNNYHYYNDNFEGAEQHAVCCKCKETNLYNDREIYSAHDTESLLRNVVRNPDRLKTIIMLQSECSLGYGRCLSCCMDDRFLINPKVDTHGKLVKAEIDKRAALIAFDSRSLVPERQSLFSEYEDINLANLAN